MAEIITGRDDIFRSGGFSIEISPASLRVTADRSALSPSKNSTGRKVVRIVFYSFLAIAILIRFAGFIAHPSVVVPLVFLVLFAPGFLFAVFRAKNDVYCTRDSMQVIRKIRGKITGTWNFPVSQVGPIRYAVFSASRYGSTCGLLFVVKEKKVKVLSGLEIVEADRVLRELERLGYQTVRDVGMPMAVEMALERRNSIFNV